MYMPPSLKAPGSAGGEPKAHRLQGVCSGSVGSAGGGGKETGGASQCSGEREVGQLLHVIPC